MNTDLNSKLCWPKRTVIGHHFYDVLHVKSCAYTVLTEKMAITFISDMWETAMTSHGLVTTESLKKANKECIEWHFFICLHLKKFCASNLETVHSKQKVPKKYSVNV